MNPDPVTELSEAPALPRLHSAQHAALNRLYDGAPGWTLRDMPLAGTLRFAPPAMAAGWVREARPFRFRLGRHQGIVAFDDTGLGLLLREPRWRELPRDLGTVLLADAAHPLVQALQDTLRLHFEWLPGDDAAPPRELPLGCEVRDAARGLRLQAAVWLDDPVAWATLLPAFDPAPRAPSPAFDLLRLPLRFEVGRTPITLREVRTITAGDIVGVERWRAAGPALHVSATPGGRTGWRLEGLADGSRITLQSIGDPSMSPQPDAALPLDRLDALEVTLQFEVGDLTVSLGELRGIHAGHVFDLGQPLNRCPVRIAAHGNVLGHGHLVAVGDRLGVRVAEFAAATL